MYTLIYNIYLARKRKTEKLGGIYTIKLPILFQPYTSNLFYSSFKSRKTNVFTRPRSTNTCEEAEWNSVFAEIMLRKQPIIIRHSLGAFNICSVISERDEQ